RPMERKLRTNAVPAVTQTAVRYFFPGAANTRTHATNGRMHRRGRAKSGGIKGRGQSSARIYSQGIGMLTPPEKTTFSLTCIGLPESLSPGPGTRGRGTAYWGVSGSA